MKPVFDWDRLPLGTILGSEVDPRTHDPTSLIIGLTEDAQARLGTERSTISLPFEYVLGIRRDEVRLNRGLRDLGPALLVPEPPAEERTLEVPAQP